MSYTPICAILDAVDEVELLILSGVLEALRANKIWPSKYIATNFAPIVAFNASILGQTELLRITCSDLDPIVSKSTLKDLTRDYGIDIIIPTFTQENGMIVPSELSPELTPEFLVKHIMRLAHCDVIRLPGAVYYSRFTGVEDGSEYIHAAEMPVLRVNILRTKNLDEIAAKETNQISMMKYIGQNKLAKVRAGYYALNISGTNNLTECDIEKCKCIGYTVMTENMVDFCSVFSQ
jgi:hypothetical protein